METLFDILYGALCPDMASTEERAILKREEAFLDEMERRLGVEDFTRLWDTLSEIGCCHAAADFRLGFWLGANLMLAANTEPFPQK